MATSHSMRLESKFDYNSDSDLEAESRPCVAPRCDPPRWQAAALLNNVARSHTSAAWRYSETSDSRPMARSVTEGAKPRILRASTLRRARTEEPAQLVAKDLVSAPKPVPALHYNSDSDSEEELDKPAVIRHFPSIPVARHWALLPVRTSTKDALSTPLTGEATDTDSTIACIPHDDLPESPSRDDENHVDEVVQKVAEEQHDDSTRSIIEVHECPRLCAAPANVTEAYGSGGLNHAHDVESRISEPKASASELEGSSPQSHEHRKEFGKRRRFQRKLLAVCGVAMDPRLKLGRQAYLSIPCCYLECASAVIVVERGIGNCSYYPFADVPAATNAYKHMLCARIMYTVEDGQLSTELQAGGNRLAHNTIRRASLKCTCK